MTRVLHKLASLLRARDRGTVAVTFILSLPLLLAIVAILVQFALLVNARLAFERALSAAARSAVTSLPANPDTDAIAPRANVERAALLALSPISPPAATANSEGQDVADALQRLNVPITTDFARRFTFARDAASFSYDPDLPVTYHARAAGQVTLTVKYPFRLNVPFARLVIGAFAEPAGLKGYYHTFTGSVDVQLSPGREVPTDDAGDPAGVAL